MPRRKNENLLAQALPPYLEAKERGLKYYRGQQCPKGHPGARYVSNRICCHCNMEASIARNAAKTSAKKQFNDILG